MIAGGQSELSQKPCLVESSTSDLSDSIFSLLNLTEDKGIQRHEFNVIHEEVRVVGGDRTSFCFAQSGHVPVRLEIGLNQTDVGVSECLVKDLLAECGNSAALALAPLAAWIAGRHGPPHLVLGPLDYGVHLQRVVGAVDDHQRLNTALEEPV